MDLFVCVLMILGGGLGSTRQTVGVVTFSTCGAFLGNVYCTVCM
jgi:hypothetical protein